MGFMSGEFPCHFRIDILLHSRDVLLLLELWNGARSCIQIYEGGSICNENPFITPPTNRVRILCHMPNKRSKRHR